MFRPSEAAFGTCPDDLRRRSGHFAASTRCRRPFLRRYRPVYCSDRDLARSVARPRTARLVWRGIHGISPVSLVWNSRNPAGVWPTHLLTAPSPRGGARLDVWTAVWTSGWPGVWMAGWLDGGTVGRLKSGWLNVWTSGRLDRSLDGWMAGWLEGWLAGWLKPGCLDVWMSGWLDGWMAGRVNVWKAEVWMAGRLEG